jgi:hypothetical protein
MRGEYDRLRQLLLQPERERLDALDTSIQRILARFGDIPDVLAEDIERSFSQGKASRLSHALAEATTGALEIAVRRRPQSVVNAVYPVIGPAIRRSLGEAMREMADDLDRAVVDALSLRSLRWRLESWRSGVPYARVVLRHTTRYRVVHLYLIEAGSGTLLGYVAANGLPDLDADAIAGMFTAIDHFVRDSVSPGGVEGGIGSATVGDYRLVVSAGPDAQLVAFVRGLPSRDFKARLDELNEELHARHLLIARENPGEAGPRFLEQAQLDDLNRADEYVAAPRRHRCVYIVLAALVLASLAYVGSGIRWGLQSRDIQDRISSTPGLVISQWDDRRRGTLRIEGLMDPMASDPRRWIAKHYPGVEVDWRMRAFVSLEPAMVRRRVARRVGLNESMVRYAGGGVARLQGVVPFAAWHRAIHAAVQVPGVDRIDSTGLTYPGHARIQRFIEELQASQVRFDSGTVSPSEGMDAVMATMLDRLDRLQSAGAACGVAFRLRTLGFTDEAGSYAQNRNLRQARAEWLAARLFHRLKIPSTITVDQEVVYTFPSASVRATSLFIAPFPVNQ